MGSRRSSKKVTVCLLSLSIRRYRHVVESCCIIIARSNARKLYVVPNRATVPYRLLFCYVLVCHVVVVTGICLWAGLATHYGLEGPVIESRWRRYFPHRPDRPWGPPRLLYNVYWVIPLAKAAGARLNHPPHLGPTLKKE